MPEYSYRCEDCKTEFAKVHSMKSVCSECESCHSSNVKKIVTSFLANTETSNESQYRFHKEQAKKDVERFYTDDKFGFNITGADDPNSEARRQKILKEQAKKNEEARKKIKKEGQNQE